jgi:hypothetical protein
VESETATTSASIGSGPVLYRDVGNSSLSALLDGGVSSIGQCLAVGEDDQPSLAISLATSDRIISPAPSALDAAE